MLGYQSGYCEAHRAASRRRWSLWKGNGSRRWHNQAIGGLKRKILVLGFVTAELTAGVLQVREMRHVVGVAEVKGTVSRNPVAPPAVD